MRVAINTLAVDPRRPGGDGTYVRELLSHLLALEDDTRYVLMVAPWSASLFPPPGPRVQHVVCPLPARSFAVRAFWEQTVLPAYIRRVEPDVFHAPVNVCPLAAKVPTVLTLLEAEPYLPGSEIPWPLRAYWRVFRSASARKASQILAISDSSLRELVQHMRLPASKLTAVHLGIALDRFRLPAPDQPRHEFILWVGRSYPRKNLLRLVDAFAMLPVRLRERHPLVLLGVPGWADRLLHQRVQALGLADQVRFAGRVADDDLLGWYQRARLFVFPSLHEAFGLPVLEALACGTPVVAASISALREVAGDAATFVDPTSVDDIALGIQKALEDPSALARAAVAGPRRGAEFSWGRAARATQTVYARARA